MGFWFEKSKYGLESTKAAHKVLTKSFVLQLFNKT